MDKSKKRISISTYVFKEWVKCCEFGLESKNFWLKKSKKFQVTEKNACGREIFASLAGKNTGFSRAQN